MTHVSPTPETNDAAIPEKTAQKNENTNYQFMGKRWHKYQNMTITKSAHIRTEM